MDGGVFSKNHSSNLENKDTTQKTQEGDWNADLPAMVAGGHESRHNSLPRALIYTNPIPPPLGE